MKWIAMVVVVVAVLALTITCSAQPSHHVVTHYRGWTAPDNFCLLHVDQLHMKNCVKAQRVIYTVFPKAHRQHAMLVSSCETGHTYDRWATNNYSYTAGLFQVHPGNHGTTWYWRGHGSITINRHRLYNSWYNARVAVYMSQGGSNWGQWDGVCHP